MSELVADSLDYRRSTYKEGYYRMRRIVPDATITALSITSETQVQFSIPANSCVNLARSILSYDLLQAAPAAKATMWHLGAMSHISSILVQPANSAERIADVRDIPQFTRALWPAVRPAADLEQSTPMAFDKTAYADYPSSGNLFFKTRLAKTVAVAASTQAGEVLSNAGADVDNAIDYDGIAEYAACSAAATAAALSVDMPLSSFPHSILSLDKDLYFGEQMKIIVNFNRSDRINWTATAVTDPETGAAVQEAATGINSLFLYLAVQQNDSVVQDLKEQVNGEGLKLTVPFVSSFVVPAALTDGVESTFLRKFNASIGQRLLKVYSAVFVADDTKTLSSNNFNNLGEKFDTVRTTLDSQPLQDYSLNLLNDEAYMWLADQLEGSCIRGARHWRQRCVWVDNFQGGKLVQWPKLDLADGGLDLSQERDYTITVNGGTTASFVLYMFAVTQKKLIIDKTGVHIR